tara:strand:+ start:2024 stop:4849 length:2826 start_codon:yes stop_codon:yes gene_type:complete
MVTRAELLAIYEEQKDASPGKSRSSKPPAKDTSWGGKALDLWEGIKESFTGDKAVGDLQERGLLSPDYDREGAPISARIRGSINPDAPGRSVKTIEAIDEEAAGKSLFKYDKTSKRLLFKKEPSQNFWDPIDPPGADPGDFAELLGDVPAMTGEALGLVLMNRFKNGRKIWDAIKTATGVGGGAAIGEGVRTGVAELTGAQEQLTEEEKYWKLFKESGKAALFAVGGSGLARTGMEVYKFAKGIPPIRWLPKVKGKNLPSEFKRRGLDVPEYIPPVIDKINRYLDPTGNTKRFNPDTAVTLNDPAFMSVVDDLAKSGPEGWKIVQDLYAENLNALLDAFDAAGPMVAGTATAHGAGVSGARALEGQMGRAERAMEGRVGEAEEGAADAMTELHAKVGDPGTSIDVGAALRSPFETKRVELQDWAEQQYSSLSKEVGDARFHPTSLADEANVQKSLFDEDLIDKTTAENRSVVEKLLKTLNTVRTTPTGGLYQDVSTISYRQLSRAISHLKTLERNFDRGMSIGLGPGVEKKALTDLRMAAMADRTRRLELMPDDVAHRHIALDEAYAAKKKELTTGVVQKLLAWKKGSQEVQDTSVFRNIFGKDATHYQASADISTVLKEGRNIEAFNDVKGSIYAQFVKENTDKATGRINTTSAKNWLEDRAQSLSNYMSPTEIAVMSNASVKSGLIKKMQIREKKFNKAMKDSNIGSYSNIDSSGLFDNIWKTASTFEKAQKVFARQFPHEWEMMRGAAVSRFKGDITSRDSVVGADIIDFKKLNNYLNNSDNLAKLELLGGKQYVTDLIMIRDGAEILARNPGRVGHDPESALAAMARAAFPPLSHGPFMFKKLKQAVTITQRKNLMNVILDPDLLHAAAKSTSNTAAQRTRQSVFGGAAALWAKSSDSSEAFDPKNRMIRDIQAIVEKNPKLRAKIDPIIRDSTGRP